MLLSDAIKYKPVLKIFSAEPNPMDYATGQSDDLDEAILQRNQISSTMEEELLAMDQKQRDEFLTFSQKPIDDALAPAQAAINLFEQDLSDYWRNKLQKAYDTYTAGNSQPLIDFFCNEMFGRIGVFAECREFFTSGIAFCLLMDKLMLIATPEEKDKLAILKEMEQNIEANVAANKIQSSWKEFHGSRKQIERSKTRNTRNAAAKKIQKAYRSYKVEQDEKLAAVSKLFDQN